MALGLTGGTVQVTLSVFENAPTITGQGGRWRHDDRVRGTTSRTISLSQPSNRETDRAVYRLSQGVAVGTNTSKRCRYADRDRQIKLAGDSSGHTSQRRRELFCCEGRLPLMITRSVRSVSPVRNGPGTLLRDARNTSCLALPVW